ncbi:MAG: phosphotransferase [Micrococcales bacterium]|nr:phosphotransferase [Micrococcales bacterium]MCL2667387.1 phosphotransferase [Micrococcales bacterium]
MHRSPVALAALATVAVPGLDPYDALELADDEHDAALVVDSQQRRWVVRAPVDGASGASMEREIALLEALEAQVAMGRLPFKVPVPVGFAPLADAGRAVVHEQIPGQTIDLEQLLPGPGLATNLGATLAALHELPTSVVETLGLPSYSPDEYRRRRQAEVDEAARTGHVPPSLLARWEVRLENVAWWRFRPTVVHGDMVAERVLVGTGEADGTVVGILGWGSAQVADPADDLAWFLVAAAADTAACVLNAYQQHRPGMVDPHLTDRAALAGELAVARWLLYGVTTGSDEIVADAVGMLADLEAQVGDADPTPAQAV